MWRGADPTAEKRAAAAEPKTRAVERTVAERLSEWQEARAPAWSQRYAREVARIVKAEITPKLGNRVLSEATRADWTARITATHRRSAAVGAMLYRTAAAFLSHAGHAAGSRRIRCHGRGPRRLRRQWPRASAC